MKIRVWDCPALNLWERPGPQEWPVGAAYPGGWAACCQALSDWTVLGPQPEDSIEAAWFLWWDGLSPKGRNCLPLWAPGWAHAGSFRRRRPLDSLQGRRKEQQPDSAATERKSRSLPV